MSVPKSSQANDQPKRPADSERSGAASEDSDSRSKPSDRYSKLSGGDRADSQYQEAVAWLWNRINYEKLGAAGSRYRFTLNRMRDLIERLGHRDRLAAEESDSTEPADRNQAAGGWHDRPAVIHIAGTKGKGSVATMVAHLLQASGHRVGLYTSPHLVHLEERFRVQGQPAAPAQMTELIDHFRPIVETMQSESVGSPSFFELTTALAVEHFHRSRCDVWVLETGLGGRLDSTNVFQSDVTAVTSIGLDHQHVLGDTLEKIAAEKAGILKRGVPAISGVTQPGPAAVIARQARHVGAPLVQLETDFWLHRDEQRPADDWGERFRVSGFGPDVEPGQWIRLELEGTHQSANAALALGMARHLCRLTGRPLKPQALAGVTLEARLEKFVRPDGRLVLLDAAHNTDSIDAMVSVIRRRFGDRARRLVFGTSADKDAASMLQRLARVFDSVVVTRYRHNPRFVPVDQLVESAAASGFADIRRADDPIQAVRAASDELPPDGLTVVCGSFFLAAEVRPFLLTPDNSR